MTTASAEFAPLDLERAKELEEIINEAGSQRKAVLIDADEGGIAGCAPTDLLSPIQSTNALVRYGRHY